MNYKQTHRYREQTDSCQREGRLGGRVRKMKRLRKKKFRHRQYGDYQREKGVGEVEEGNGGTNGNERFD